MKIPINYTEAQVLEIINNISNNLAKKFKFAYYTEDDIRQEIFCEAIKGLERYDEVRPLENFLAVHIKNRLINFKRDNYQRPGKPCVRCPHFNKKCESECDIFNDKVECDLYSGWLNRNIAKKNVISPIDISIIDDENERNTKFFEDVNSDLYTQEMLDIIDCQLPVSVREDYLKMRCGVKLSKSSRLKVQEAVLEILQKYGYVQQ